MAGRMIPRRLAILECDTPIEVVKNHRGSYGDCFERLLRSSLANGSPRLPQIELKFSKWDAVQSQFPDLQDIDAVLLTGSRHCSFDNSEWLLRLVRYVQQAYEEKIPIIGICFGHQVVARAMGGRTEKNEKGWEIAVCNVDLSDTGRKLFGKDKLSIQQMHRDVVPDCPPGLESLGSSAGCSIQGLYMPHRVLTLQGHPEFDEFIISEIVKLRHAQGIFDDLVAQDALSRAGVATDAGIVGTAMCAFLSGALDGP